MLHIKILCDKCDNIYEQDIQYISDINWNCPKCNSRETAIIEFEDDEPDDSQIVMGKGGCGKQRTW